MTGSYITEDDGANWRMFNLRGVTRFFEWDPADPKVIYAGNNGLYRSADSGRSWRLIYPAAARVTGVDMGNDHADETILVDGRPADRVTALAIDPANSKKLYAAMGNSLKISDDAGATWRMER